MIGSLIDSSAVCCDNDGDDIDRLSTHPISCMMRLSRLHFCYGSILTSVVWLSLIIIYFNIHEAQMPSQDHHPMMSAETDVFQKRRRVISTKNKTLSLPDLDRLAVVRNRQDKLLRADGIHCKWIVNLTNTAAVQWSVISRGLCWCQIWKSSTIVYLLHIISQNMELWY